MLIGEFELTEPEANFIINFMSSAIYGQENEKHMWVAYTLLFCEALKTTLLSL